MEAVSHSDLTDEEFEQILKDNLSTPYEIVHREPLIVHLENFITDEQISALSALAEGKFQRSTIVYEGKLIHSTSRTSETAFLTDIGHRNTYEKPIEDLLDIVQRLSGCKRHQIESLMMVHYQEGQQYSDHHDYFNEQSTAQLSYGGQRIATFFLWLTDLEDAQGGETEFPLLEKAFVPRKGSGLFWWNKRNGQLEDKTLHRGNQVLSGEKYGLNIWIREKGWQ